MYVCMYVCMYNDYEHSQGHLRVDKNSLNKEMLNFSLYGSLCRGRVDRNDRHILEIRKLFVCLFVL